MDQNQQKLIVAEAALDFIGSGEILGVGTGSTVNFFIDALAKVKGKIDGVVSSSDASTKRLQAIGLNVLDLNRTGNLSLYVDGADEATKNMHLIKGGGGALTREKIVASASRRFVCIVDESKVYPISDPFLCPWKCYQWHRASSQESSSRWAVNPNFALALRPIMAI